VRGWRIFTQSEGVQDLVNHSGDHVFAVVRPRALQFPDTETHHTASRRRERKKGGLTDTIGRPIHEYQLRRIVLDTDRQRREPLSQPAAGELLEIVEDSLAPFVRQPARRCIQRRDCGMPCHEIMKDVDQRPVPGSMRRRADGIDPGSLQCRA
jgi:hypothetical protein